MEAPAHEFLRQAGRILNSGQSRSITLTGSIHDLFLAPDGRYLPLIDFLSQHWRIPHHILLVYELNGPIRFADTGDVALLRAAWLQWRTGLGADDLAIKRMLSPDKVDAQTELLQRDFDQQLQQAVGQPTVALEFLRQLCLCSRSTLGGRPLLTQNLIILIEAADLILPEGEAAHLSDRDRHRMSICHDWFSDPGFINGGDSVVLIAESRSQINQRVARLPHLLDVTVPAPDEAARLQFIAWYRASLPSDLSLELWASDGDLARATAGLSIHALLQMLKGAVHQCSALSQADVVDKVAACIERELGEDMVEFKRPRHTLDDVVGFTRLKTFLREELMPRLNATGEDALSGAAVGGAIGSGKTFIFEAVAAEMDMPVLVLKNIRSQWYGQTDVLFERLRRVLEALSKVLIFVDEADTQFGGVGPEEQATERRLTGKIQAMMSDPRLRGRVTWLLMTARIHLLSPDIRRPGRAGDLIIPVFDPEGDDRAAFIHWMVKPVLGEAVDDTTMAALNAATKSFAAANFAAMRAELKAKHRLSGPLDLEGTLAAIRDHLPAPIGDTRRYQTLQALVNCTRRSLLPSPEVTDEERAKWTQEIAALEARGIR